MKLNKIQRENIKQKFDGKCAYCGEVLSGRWHVDHIEPVIRTENGFIRPENNKIDNLNPSCVPCNLSKSRMSLEDWRDLLEGHVKSLNMYHPIYRMSKRYGLIQETGKRVVFHFEKQE